VSVSTRQPVLVVAGMSVRALAESARQAGWDVVALDLFGDLDTRRASRRWLRIGEPADLAIDPQRLRTALAEASAEPGVVGWVAGSGFEADPSLLACGEPHRLPLLGMDADAVAAVRDARRFFAVLDRHALPHPPTVFAPPVPAHGWLAKRAGGSGGWHIRDAAALGAPSPDTYWQRLQPGTPMSALFVADGRRARVVALNRLLVQPVGGHPHVYAGAIGPIADAALHEAAERALEALVPAFALRGLGSLDFIAAHGRPWWLEVNPRPSASMLLHAQAWPEGLVHAHVQAVQGRLPAAAPCHRPGVRGHRIVFAPHAGRLDAAQAARLADCTDCHDLPAGPAQFARGEPVCSVSAEAADADAVNQRLRQRCAQVASRLTALEEIPS
jgi:uncharacterized protein